jgi:hypothetical protein
MTAEKSEFVEGGHVIRRAQVDLSFRQCFQPIFWSGVAHESPKTT